MMSQDQFGGANVVGVTTSVDEAIDLIRGLLARE
jgi:hypothetical protein